MDQVYSKKNFYLFVFVCMKPVSLFRAVETHSAYKSIRTDTHGLFNDAVSNISN